MKGIFSLLLLGLNLSAWGGNFKIITSSKIIRAGRPFDITLHFKKEMKNISSVALELSPLSDQNENSVAFVKGEFLKGNRMEEKKRYRFKSVIIPKKGWWKLNIIVIKEDAYLELNDPFLYETERAIKVRE